MLTNTNLRPHWWNIAQTDVRWIFVAIMAALYLLNGLFSSFNFSCLPDIPVLFQPRLLAWFWSFLLITASGAGLGFYSRPSRVAWQFATIVIGLQCTLTPDVMPMDLKIEGHFVFFVVLVFIAMRASFGLFITYTTLVLIGHTLLGIFAPMCIYGVTQAPFTRALTHAAFIGAESFGLFIFIVRRKLDKAGAALADDLSHPDIMAMSDIQLSHHTRRLVTDAFRHARKEM